MNGIGNRGRTASDIDGASIVDHQRCRTLRRTQVQAGSLHDRTRTGDGESTCAAGLAGDGDEARINGAAVFDCGGRCSGARNPEKLAVQCGVVDVERIGDASVKIVCQSDTVGVDNRMIGDRQRGRAVEADTDILVQAGGRSDAGPGSGDVDRAVAAGELADVQEIRRQGGAGRYRQIAGAGIADRYPAVCADQGDRRARPRCGDGAFVVDIAGLPGGPGIVVEGAGEGAVVGVDAAVDLAAVVDDDRAAILVDRLGR